GGGARQRGSAGPPSPAEAARRGATDRRGSALGAPATQPTAPASAISSTTSSEPANRSSPGTRSAISYARRTSPLNSLTATMSPSPYSRSSSAGVRSTLVSIGLL